MFIPTIHLHSFSKYRNRRFSYRGWLIDWLWRSQSPCFTFHATIENCLKVHLKSGHLNLNMKHWCIDLHSNQIKRQLHSFKAPCFHDLDFSFCVLFDWQKRRLIWQLFWEQTEIEHSSSRTIFSTSMQREVWFGDAKWKANFIRRGAKMANGYSKPQLAGINGTIWYRTGPIDKAVSIWQWTKRVCRSRSKETN